MLNKKKIKKSDRRISEISCDMGKPDNMDDSYPAYDNITWYLSVITFLRPFRWMVVVRIMDFAPSRLILLFCF